MNLGHRDLDEDGLRDACDLDTDGDGVVDEEDGCPRVADPEQIDSDGDGRGDTCDDTDDRPDVPELTPDAGAPAGDAGIEPGGDAAIPPTMSRTTASYSASPGAAGGLVPMAMLVVGAMVAGRRR